MDTSRTKLRDKMQFSSSFKPKTKKLNSAINLKNHKTPQDQMIRQSLIEIKELMNETQFKPTREDEIPTKMKEMIKNMDVLKTDLNENKNKMFDMKKNYDFLEEQNKYAQRNMKDEMFNSQKQEISYLTKKINQLKIELENSNEENRELLNLIRDLEKQKNELISKLNNQKKEQNYEIQKLKQENQILNDEVNEKKNNLFSLEKKARNLKQENNDLKPKVVDYSVVENLRRENKTKIKNLFKNQEEIKDLKIENQDLQFKIKTIQNRIDLLQIEKNNKERAFMLKEKELNGIREDYEESKSQFKQKIINDQNMIDNLENVLKSKKMELDDLERILKQKNTEIQFLKDQIEERENLYSRNLNKSQNNNEKLKNKNNDLLSQLDITSDQKNKLEKEIIYLKEHIQNLTNNMSSQKTKMDKKDREIEDLNQKLLENEKKIKMNYVIKITT